MATILKKNYFLNSHFDPFDLDPPGVRGLVQGGLHPVGNLLPLRQDLGQTLGAQHIPAKNKNTFSQARVTYIG